MQIDSQIREANKNIEQSFNQTKDGELAQIAAF